jgi:hypothetical protein
MSTQIPVSFVDQFKANLLVLSQQKVSMLRSTCRMEDVTGDTMFVERIGPKDAQLRGARHGATPISDADHSRRKLTMADYVVPADIIDKPDKLKMLIDPQGAYVRNQDFSLRRQIDDVIITALGGPAYSGHTGATTVNNYDVGECRLIESDGTIATAGSDWSNTTETALTIAKLLTCKQLLDDAEIDESRQRYFVTNPYNLNQLMNTTEVKSSDYNTVKALAQGKVDTFMGFKFIKSTRLSADDTDTGATKCYAFAQDAIVLAIAEEPTVSIRPSSCRNHPRYCIVERG